MYIFRGVENDEPQTVAVGAMNLATSGDMSAEAAAAGDCRSVLMAFSATMPAVRTEDTY